MVSGFLIALSYKRSHDVWAFYVRRIFRIYPMYACVVLVQTAILMSLLPGGPLSAPESTLRYLATNLVMANFLQYDIAGMLNGLPTPGINPSLWTLKIELGFYLIVPLIIMAVRRWGWQVLVFIFVASVAYDALTTAPRQFARQQLPGQMQFFVVGMAFAMFRQPVRLHPLISVAVGLHLLCLLELPAKHPAGDLPDHRRRLRLLLCLLHAGGAMRRDFPTASICCTRP